VYVEVSHEEVSSAISHLEGEAVAEPAEAVTSSAPKMLGCVFSMGEDNIELRSCNDGLSLKEPHTTAEIIKREPLGGCYTLARWIRDSEGFDLRFVGDRPAKLKGKEREAFWRAYERGQKLLDSFCREED